MINIKSLSLNICHFTPTSPLNTPGPTKKADGTNLVFFPCMLTYIIYLYLVPLCGKKNSTTCDLYIAYIGNQVDGRLR